MIDYHCHLLSGVDDGPETLEESLEMATALHKAGFQKIYCTPHLLKGHYDADNKQVLSATSELRKRLSDEKINLEILPGREYYLDEFLGQYLSNPLPLGKTKFIMIEVPNYAPSQYVKEACFRIKCSGFIPMIAHPERSRLFAANIKPKTTFFSFRSTSKVSEKAAKRIELISYLKNIGCAFQGNLGSFYSIYGPDVQNTAYYLKENKVYTHYGTDAHSLKGINRIAKLAKDEKKKLKI
ncbi:MAG: CpsB/CapC family capsule biosynthesis tyrosine phosphatase [Smithella sp.]